MKAFLKNFRQAPRKVRLIGDLIKGKKVIDAETELNALIKRGALPIKKLLDSAVANAKQNGIEKENLMVLNVRVDKGVVLKRFRPRARGSASRINKRNSHIEIILKERDGVDTKKKTTKKEVTKEVKNTETKKATEKSKVSKESKAKKVTKANKA